MKLRESAKEVKFNWKNFLWISIVHIVALGTFWYFYTWQGLVLFLVLTYLTGMVGITFGFHRLLAHKSFKTVTFVQNFAAFCGTLACQGGPISWIGQHRVHHAYSDLPEDPHNINKGFCHSHIGFIFNRREDLNSISEIAHYCPDIAKNKFFCFLEYNMIKIQIIIAISMFICGGLLFGKPGFDWFMGMSFIIWGTFLRLVAVYHITWLVNSATHTWGSKPNHTADKSCNNWWVGILAFGEGWHNNHHAQPRSARHGWTWWQFDQTWILILSLKKLKLVSDIKLPNRVPTNIQKTHVNSHKIASI